MKKTAYNFMKYIWSANTQEGKPLPLLSCLLFV